MQVFCLTWGIFVITQTLCNSCPNFVIKLVDYEVTLSSELSNRAINSVPYVRMVASVWFDVGVVTTFGCLAAILYRFRRINSHAVQRMNYPNSMNSDGSLV